MSRNYQNNNQNRYYQRGYEEYRDSERWNGGYDRRFASKADDKPTITSLILGKISSINVKRNKTKINKSQAIKVKNVKYHSCDKVGEYGAYLMQKTT